MDFVFPNEANVTWTVMIVLYPYITGLVAGAFIVSSLYHVFGRTKLKPVARYSLASAFVFLIFAPLPLLFHLGHPERAFNIMITPNFSSAMAGFGFIYLIYMLIVVLEIWSSVRTDLIERAKGKGLIPWLSRVILLFNLYEDDLTKQTDKKVTRFLAGLGIPMACLLHGYVGFLFGAIKANPWWSTPMMFVIFIFSAIVSGISMIVFHYFIASWINGWKVDQECVRALGKYLWGFMIIAISMEMLEIISLAYKQTEEWDVLGTLITQKLFFSYIIMQFMVFALIPFFMLAAATLLKLKEKLTNALIWTAAVMLLVQVLLMRWNVIIGGQLLSKSMRGFTEYLPGIWNREGLIMAAVLFTMPFIMLYFFHRFIPLFPDAVKKTALEPGSQE